MVQQGAARDKNNAAMDFKHYLLCQSMHTQSNKVPRKSFLFAHTLQKRTYTKG